MKRVIAPRETRRALSGPTTLIVVLVLGVFSGCAPRTHVTQSGPCPSSPLEDARFGVRYLPCQLTKVPVLQIDTAIWRYPDMLRSAGVAGRTRVAFIVDTAGRYVLGSGRVLSSSNEQFSSAAKYGLSRAQFSVGRRGRKPVSVELTHDFVYALPGSVNPRELDGIPREVTLTSVRSSDAVPELEIRLDADDTRLAPPPDPVLRDSLAHTAIRTRARELGWADDSAPRASTAKDLVFCVQGDERVLESAADRALAASMTRPHVRVMTMRGCPQTRESMAPLLPGEKPRHYPDSATFVEPRRLYVTAVGLRRGGRPVVNIADEQGLSGHLYHCVQVPRAPSIFALRCFLDAITGH